MQANVIEHIDGLSSVLPRYKGIICDIWGVVHNGQRPFKAAVDALLKAKGTGVDLVLLTNAPRPHELVKEQLAAMGVPGEIFQHVVTSGSLARQHVVDHFNGAALYHMGPSQFDAATVEGLPVTWVQDIGDADAILATGLDHHGIDDHRPTLDHALEKELLFLCANPDRIVDFGDEQRLCAGAIADLYACMGGKVAWFGKPMRQAYEACLQYFQNPISDSREVLAIGDGLFTDIQGAVTSEADSLLITSGIHKDLFIGHRQSMSGEELEALFKRESCPVPTMKMPQLTW